jgi:hypothetical protein
VEQNKHEVIIKIRGCDASTWIKTIVNDAEKQFLDQLSEISKQVSTYQCMPDVTIMSKNTLKEILFAPEEEDIYQWNRS